jgi:hypothetical protein
MSGKRKWRESMETIEVADNLVIEIHDGEIPSLRIHNDDGDGIVVVWPSQIGALRDALAEAGGVAASMVAGEHGKAVIV